MIKVCTNISLFIKRKEKNMQKTDNCCRTNAFLRNGCRPNLSLWRIASSIQKKFSLRKEKTLLVLLLTGISIFLNARESPKCIWEFGKDKISPEQITGDLKISGTSFFLDGTNVLRLPPGILKSKEYTIEFELKTQNRKEINLFIFSMQDCDYEKGSFRMIVPNGFAFAYYAFGAGMLYANSSQTSMSVNEGTCPIPWGKDNVYLKQTFLVKDGKLYYFRDGLILLITDSFPPPAPGAVLRFGQLRGKKNAPAKLKSALEIRNLKIYDGSVFPTGYDPSIRKRMNYSGPEYSLMREAVKDPKKKRILVVGDSISMSYRGQIAEHVKDRAYVDYWMGGTWFGPGVIKDGEKSKPAIAWKGVASHGPYDIVTFNPQTLHWWSLKFKNRCSETYLADTLQFYFDCIRKSMPNAKIIWIRCTPHRSLLPDGSSSVDNDEDRRIRKFNDICDKVVAKNKIPSVDLYSIALRHLPKVKKHWKDPVHWDRACADDFALAICSEIDQILKKQP